MLEVHVLGQGINPHVAGCCPFQAGIRPSQDRAKPCNGECKALLRSITGRVTVPLVVDIFGVHNCSHGNGVDGRIHIAAMQGLPTKRSQKSTAQLRSVNGFLRWKSFSWVRRSAYPGDPMWPRIQNVEGSAVTMHQGLIGNHDDIPGLWVDLLQGRSTWSTWTLHIAKRSIGNRDDASSSKINRPENQLKLAGSLELLDKAVCSKDGANCSFFALKNWNLKCHIKSHLSN